MIIPWDGIHLLFIEPKLRAHEPIIDELTLKMSYAYVNSTTYNIKSCEYYNCICGAQSKWKLKLDNGMLTNSLCVHYVACHRDEVPKKMIKVISSFDRQSLRASDASIAYPWEEMKLKQINQSRKYNGAKFLFPKQKKKGFLIFKHK